ncbi:MAG: hypothetical protein Q9166_003563 [cf. Caloplaca sp. 2 TL-2023]
MLTIVALALPLMIRLPRPALIRELPSQETISHLVLNIPLTFAVSLGRWPYSIDIPGQINIVLKVSKIKPIKDVSVAWDMKQALNGLRDHVCYSPKESSLQIHTMTSVTALCPDFAGRSAAVQRTIFRSTLLNIIQGQDTYGPAALWGKISHRVTGRTIGSIESELFADGDIVPPKAEGSWPRNDISTDIRPSHGRLSVRIQTTGPTLDTWDTFWYLYILMDFIQLVEKLEAQQPAQSFERVLSKQTSRVGFVVNKPPGGPPSNGDMVMLLQEIWIIVKEFGVRLLQFQLLNARKEVLGVGQLDRAPNGQTIAALGDGTEIGKGGTN